MTALITGANRGVGRALFDALQARGDTVIGTHRGLTGGDWIALDVADPASVRAMADTVGDRPIDLLVCNAGVFEDRDMALDDGYPADMWAREFAVNTTGVFLTVQALLPNLRAARGKVAIVSSQLGSQTIASGGSYIYRASKAAAVNIGRNLAVDLRDDGIAVGIYHPGWVQTDMGGATAAITPTTSAAGLIDRFASLTLDNSGTFETYDGQTHPL
ncbi:SDR family oxidoreductase [Loktanella sp. SALINAS62]|uniref:SDR family oxidoreductase n=1 Tax=Loktanella sp. SALINAS62 TaxID=2706124 RepID=UPI001B8C7AB8|nr:SDR family oxidoreductase [Loktanella sp. SALINAS62]MBS1300806.1 SDR family oxidoreductase [Loktanella sp. SALINAS62]